MTTVAEEKIIARLEILESLLIGKITNWIPKETLEVLTGLKSKTINNLVSEGRIVKKGNLYSYRSYLEHCGIKGM